MVALGEGPWIQMLALILYFKFAMAKYLEESTTLSGCDKAVNHLIPHWFVLDRKTHAHLPCTVVIIHKLSIAVLVLFLFKINIYFAAIFK